MTGLIRLSHVKLNSYIDKLGEQMGTINGNVLVIKEINIGIVRNALKILRVATKAEIAKETGLTTATVGTILQVFLEEGEISEEKKVKSNGGRPAQQFSYNFDYMNALTIYPFIQGGKTRLNVTVIDLEGVSLESEIVEIDEVNITNLKAVAKEKLGKYPKIKMIGIGNSGINREGVILQSTYDKLIGCDISNEFQNEFGVPSIVENNVNSAVIGFIKRKPSLAVDRSKRDLVYLFFPEKTAPGAGLLINGEVYTGYNNYAGGIAYYNQVEWGEKLYKDFDEFCDVVSAMINFTSCMLNPSSVILAGNSLSDEHLERIKEICAKDLIEDMLPKVFLSKNFHKDYKKGLITKTLEALVPNLSIRRK